MVRVSAPNLLFRRLVNTTNLTLDTGLIPYERYTLGIAFQNQLLQGPEERIGFHMLQSSKSCRALSLVELMMHMYTCMYVFYSTIKAYMGVLCCSSTVA